MCSNKQIINTIGTLVSTAFVCTGLGLFVAGYSCTYNNKPTVSGNCETIYIAGIFMTFFIGVAFVFALLFCLVERCDQKPPQTQEEAVVVHVRPKKKINKPTPLTTNILHKTLTEESARALTEALEKVVKNPMKVKRKSPLTSVAEHD
jgi:hypothetical protein